MISIPCLTKSQLTGTNGDSILRPNFNVKCCKSEESVEELIIKLGTGGFLNTWL